MKPKLMQTGLLTLLKSIHKPCNIKDFRGLTIGVDAYGWLHRGAVPAAVDLAIGKPSRKSDLLIPTTWPVLTTYRYVDFAMHRVRMLIHYGVVPYLVFDGDHLPSKAGTEQERASRRQESRRTGLELLRLGKTAQAYQELQKAVDITPEMARQLIEALKAANVYYVVAPYEADSQLAYLERTGTIDGVLSEDSDLLIFGVNCLLTKLDQYGDCVMIRRDDFTACQEVNLNGWSNADLRHMAILSGCDYLQGIHNMGLKTAHRLVRKYKNVPRIIHAAQLESKFRIPEGYLASFQQAEMTFLHQWVFCPRAKRLVHLTEPENEFDTMSYLGEEVDVEVARGVACGDLNPMTKQKITVAPEPVRRSHSWSVNRNMKTPIAASSIVGKEGKSIDSFFKPKRVPLAELDPNILTPSLSQQRLLDQHNTRGWTSDPAPARRTASIPVSFSPQPTNSAAVFRGNKRQRLCVPDEQSTDPRLEIKGEKSRFFSTPTVASHFHGETTSKSRQSADKVNIWSDDSIGEAMAELPDFSSTILPPPTVTRPALKTGFTETLGDALLAPPVPGLHDATDDADETIFSAGLRARFEYSTNPSQAPTLSFFSSAQSVSQPSPCTPDPQIDGHAAAHVSPSTPPPGARITLVRSPSPAFRSLHVDDSPLLSEEDAPLPPLLPETPPPPPQSQSRGVGLSPAHGVGEPPGFTFSTAAHKGSEDLLLIPDSEPGSEVGVHAADNGTGVDGDEEWRRRRRRGAEAPFWDEVERGAGGGGGPGAALTPFDVSRFAFAGG